MQNLKVAKEPAKGGVQVTLLELMAAEEPHRIRLGVSALGDSHSNRVSYTPLGVVFASLGWFLIIDPFASLASFAVRLLFSFADLRPSR
jgi:hypothetical protein